MLLLFETPAGYSLFKVNDSKKFSKTDTDDIYDKFFSSPEKASKLMSMVSFQPFADTADAVAAATACQEGKVYKTLQKFINKKIVKASPGEELVIADKALASSLKESFDDKLKIVHDSKTQELFRGIRSYMDELLGGEGGIDPDDLHKMQLGLSHSLSRYKLKFSADKVDTMVIQAVGLLDELDKEINTYAMRVKEWYGWHFPELQAIVGDNAQYSRLVLKAGHRPTYKDLDLSDILEDESTEAAVKEAAEISMGTDITDLDVMNIQSLADQVLSMTEYRSQLFEYLRNRMNAIAPNLTILVGELVGARLISHAGSLLNLAKQPASTVQILGAEKALFRALKTKHNTPKYGLIYHASLIGQAAPKHKGKISRVLAAKASLAIRVDALSDDVAEDDAADTTIGFEGRAKVEARLRQLETGGAYVAPKTSAVTAKKTAKYDPVAAKISTSTAVDYNPVSDVQMQVEESNNNSNSDDDNEKSAKKKKKKKDKKEKKEKKKRKSKEGTADDDAEETPKKKKRKLSEGGGDDSEEKKSSKKSSKKSKKEKRKSKES